MKLLKKKGVAITIMIAAILLSSLYGLSKRPQVEVPEGGGALNESLSTAAFTPYLVDQADVLSSSQEEVRRTESFMGIYPLFRARGSPSITHCLLPVPLCPAVCRQSVMLCQPCWGD